MPEWTFWPHGPITHVPWANFHSLIPLGMPSLSQRRLSYPLAVTYYHALLRRSGTSVATVPFCA